MTSKSRYSEQNYLKINKVSANETTRKREGNTERKSMK